MDKEISSLTVRTQVLHHHNQITINHNHRATVGLHLMDSRATAQTRHMAAPQAMIAIPVTVVLYLINTAVVQVALKAALNNMETTREAKDPITTSNTIHRHRINNTLLLKTTNILLRKITNTHHLTNTVNLPRTQTIKVVNIRLRHRGTSMADHQELQHTQATWSHIMGSLIHSTVVACSGMRRRKDNTLLSLTMVVALDIDGKDDVDDVIDTHFQQLGSCLGRVDRYLLF